MAGYLEKLKSLKTGTQGTAKTAKSPFYSKCSDRGRHISEMIPPPEPSNLGPVYAGLWDAAWRLADEIDNPVGAPIEERRARLPELLAMNARMAEIERQAVPTAAIDPEPVKPASREGTPATTEPNPNRCPARCKRSGKCYGRVWFDGKPGPSRLCDPRQCPWEDRFEK